MSAYRIEEFELSCLEIGEEFDLSPFRDDTRAQFLYEGAFQFPCIRVNGNFRVLKTEYRGVSFYQLEIDAESEFFNNLKKRVEELCGHNNNLTLLIHINQIEPIGKPMLGPKSIRL